MDDIIEAVIELLGELLEAALIHIKDPQKRKWALTIFYSVIVVVLAGFMIWLAVECYLEGNRTGAAVLAVIALLIGVIFGIFIIRGHRQNWKNKRDI